jgi:lipopolysaccharide/colanic/teichoic acid biosynthesis glycosyltransferase
MRFFDILFSLMAIFVFSPILIVVILILLLTGEHEVFYLQKRMGRGFKPFNVFKFVTMKKNSEKMEGGDVTQKNDARVLPFGKFLRKSKLNELPQLFNIFIGNMSVVGPRPLTPPQFYNYSDKQQKFISLMTPGLSGIGSLIFRDEEGIMDKIDKDNSFIHDKIITPYKGDLECWYYEKRNLLMYFKIIMLTVLSVFNSDKKYRASFEDLPKPAGLLSELI